MSSNTRQIGIDGYTKCCLTVIVLLLAAIFVAVAWQQVTIVPTASAAAGADDQLFGNSSAWRDSMLKAADGTNSRLDDLLKALKSGEIKVQVAEKGAGDAPAKK